MQAHHSRWLIAATAATLLLAACGGGSKKASTATTAPATTPTSALKPAATPPVVACTPTASATPTSLLHYQAPSQTANQVTLTSVQTQTQACSDQITFTFAGNDLPGYDAKQVPAALQCASGLPVTTQGAKQIMVSFTPVVAHDANGNLTVAATNLTPSYASLKQAVESCDFEADVAWVLGTEDRFYTLTTAQSPTRIVIEIEH